MTSRRELYAHGEPLGGSTTRKKLGGGYVCGFGGDGGSSSSSSSTYSSNDTTTNNIRKDIANDGGYVATDGASVSVINNSLDKEIVSRALSTVDMANATNAQGFTQLLDASKGLFDRGESLIGMTQKSVADAYNVAQTTKAGTIDNKTIIVLAIAGAATVYAISRKG